MLDKQKYIELVKFKKYDEVIKKFQDDFAKLFCILLDKKNISYEKKKSFYYYLNILKKYYPELNQSLVFIEQRINDDNIDIFEKINILIDKYSCIYKLI